MCTSAERPWEPMAWCLVVELVVEVVQSGWARRRSMLRKDPLVLEELQVHRYGVYIGSRKS